MSYFDHFAVSPVPFGTDEDGKAVVFDWQEDPHLLVAGPAGQGKSVALQTLIVGFLHRNSRVLVIEPTKGAADFQFLRPWTDFVADDLLTSAAVLRAVYAEVRRRVMLNKQHGTSSYRDLPEGVRPDHVAVVIDEFEQLVLPEDVPETRYDDAERKQDRHDRLELNATRREIGMLVGRIAREARSAGVTLLLATQRLSTAALQNTPGLSESANSCARLLVGRTTFAAKAAMLRNPKDAPDLGEQVPPGRGIFETSASGPVAVKVWHDLAENLKAALAENIPARTDKFDPIPYLWAGPTTPPS